jgi:hypothetical protein
MMNMRDRSEADAEHEEVGRRAAGDVDGDVEFVLAQGVPELCE